MMFEIPPGYEDFDFIDIEGIPHVNAFTRCESDGCSEEDKVKSQVLQFHMFAPHFNALCYPCQTAPTVLAKNPESDNG